MEHFVNLLLSITDKLGYLGIVILMAIESSFIPFPSEIIIPPAAYLASKGEMNIILVVAFGTLGSLIGALFNYYFAYFLGRLAVYKFAKTKFATFILLNEENIKKSEALFKKYGNISTFIGRLIIAVRQLISLPAGFVKMPLLPFLLFTLLGSLTWIIILAALGYYWGENSDVLKNYYNEISYILLGLLFAGIMVLISKKYLKKRKCINAQ